MTVKRPFFVLVPGASQSPAQYGYLFHLLMQAGYPVYTGLLPSVGCAKKISVDDDVAYVRNKLLLPVLDFEEHDVILVMHSYSSVPGSAAATGLSKKVRGTQGKKTGVIGQIYLASILAKGGDGKDIVSAFGGRYPPHIRPDPDNNLLRCDDRIPPLFQDVTPADLADVAATSAIAQGMTSFVTPCPPASWDNEEYRGRVAFIRTLRDACIPLPVQQMMLDGTGVQWIVRDVDSGHSPQISKAEELTVIMVELAERLRGVGDEGKGPECLKEV